MEAIESGIGIEARVTQTLGLDSAPLKLQFAQHLKASWSFAFAFCSLSWGVTYLLISETKYLTRNNLKEEGFILNYSLRVHHSQEGGVVGVGEGR